ENTEGEVIRNAYMQELLDEAAIDAGGSPVPSLILNGTERAVREMIDMRRKAASLTVLINAMAAMDGRKALLMATRRFGEYAGWEFIGCGLCPPGTEQERFNMRMLHDDLTKNANAAAVTLYTVYPEGLVDIPMANVEQGPRPYRTFYRTDAIADAQKLSKSNAILLNETKA